MAGVAVGDRPQALLGLAIDGKTVRNAATADGDVQLFSAMAHGAAIVVGQVRVPAGTTEVTQVRALPAGLDLDGRVVTADAAHAQHDTADYIVAERGGDYVLHVKANQPGLLRQIADTLPRPWWPRPTGVPSNSATGTPCAGRCGSPTPTRWTFPEAARAFRLLRERFDPFGVRVAKEVVHGVTSLSAERATAQQIAGFVRGQWGIEVRRDVALCE